MTEYDILIVGGGAAGFFTAINAAEMNPSAKIAILERGNEVLTKVRISGGGRCNVTHAEFIPKELASNYPRGEKELRGPFYTFMTGDTISWFEKHGVPLKTEADGRMFPQSNTSQSIIDCFLMKINNLGIALLKKHSVKGISLAGEKWMVKTNQTDFSAKKLMIASGSNPKMWNLLEILGHSIVPPVPSLFTFNIKDKRIADLPGISTFAAVEVCGEKLFSDGSLLITHWGMSGPAILKLSAWGALELSKLQEFEIKVNWLPELSVEDVLEQLQELKLKYAKQQLIKYSQFDLPKRLWQNLVLAAGIPENTKWADTNKNHISDLTSQLSGGIFIVHGKSTFKEEFVTAGGVDLKEVDFRTFGSKIHKNLFFAGEVLNIDAITGGFNFQNAWTGGYIAARAMTINNDQ